MFFKIPIAIVIVIVTEIIPIVTDSDSIGHPWRAPHMLHGLGLVQATATKLALNRRKNTCTAKFNDFVLHIHPKWVKSNALREKEEQKSVLTMSSYMNLDHK